MSIKIENELINNINMVYINENLVPSKKEYKFNTLPGDFDEKSNLIKALYIAINSNYLSSKMNLNLATSIPVIHANYDLSNKLGNKIISDLEIRIENIEKEYNEYFSDPNTFLQISKKFSPSKTAVNGLNFVNKDEETNLCNNEQPDEILNVFRIVYYLINEDFSDVPQNELIENLIYNIMPKLGVDNLSKIVKLILQSIY
jgi:hypothetical protein